MPEQENGKLLAQRDGHAAVLDRRNTVHGHVSPIALQDQAAACKHAQLEVCSEQNVVRTSQPRPHNLVEQL